MTDALIKKDEVVAVRPYMGSNTFLIFTRNGKVFEYYYSSSIGCWQAKLVSQIDTAVAEVQKN